MEGFCPYTCSYKTGAGYCGRTGGYLSCQYQAVHGNTAVGFVPPEPKTRADRIRSMSDEELAEYMSIYCCSHKTHDPRCQQFKDCGLCWLDWLRQEADA